MVAVPAAWITGICKCIKEIANSKGHAAGRIRCRPGARVLLPALLLFLRPNGVGDHGFDHFNVYVPY